MSRHPKSLLDALKESSATAALVSRVRASEHIAKLLAASGTRLPGFDPLVAGSCEMRGRSLHLRVSSSAVAAKLRQLLPTLRANLQRQGVDLSEIKVQVQLNPPKTTSRGEKETPNDRRPGPLTPRNPQGAQHFAQDLVSHLADSPLRQAAQRLVQSLNKRFS